MRRRDCWRAAGAWAAAAALPGWAGATTGQLQDWPVRRAAPAWQATDLQGRRWTGESLQGKPVLLNFWASWCAPCLDEMPTLAQLADFHGSALRVVAINYKEPAFRVQRFLRANALNLQAMLDVPGEAAQAWGVHVFPTSFLIDRQGRPRHFIQGDVDWTAPTAMGWIDRLLAA